MCFGFGRSFLSEILLLLATSDFLALLSIDDTLERRRPASLSFPLMTAKNSLYLFSVVVSVVISVGIVAVDVFASSASEEDFFFLSHFIFSSIIRLSINITSIKNYQQLNEEALLHIKMISG